MKNTLIIAVVVGVIMGSITLFTSQGKTVEGSAPSGLPATVYSRAFIDVGPQQNIILASGGGFSCASRVVGTAGAGIMLNFSTSTSLATSTTQLSGNKGVWQAASTTVAYDSGIFGCDYLVAHGSASSTITVLEFR